MTTSLAYHFASGHAFFSGVALVTLGVWVAGRKSGRWWSRGRTVLACLGLILIAGSATPLSEWFYAVAGMFSLAWLGFEGTTSARFRSTRLALRSSVLLCWWLGLAFEIPYHFSPIPPPLGNPVVSVIGDSISAGVGGEAMTWPRILADRHGIEVIDLSVAGLDVAKARKQAAKVVEPRSLVIAEIGGNDLLGSTLPEALERDLDALLARLKEDGRTVVLLELPLPPGYNRFGRIQRKLAARHGVLLVPRRVLMGILASGGATLDSIHLSQTGHARMAETIWKIVQPAFRPIPASR